MANSPLALRHLVELQEHEILGVPHQDEIQLFLHSGVNTAVAAEDTSGVPENLATSIGKAAASAAERFRAIVDSIPVTATLSVLSEHPGASLCLDYVREKATVHRQIIIAPLGPRTGAKGCLNQVAVVFPDGEPVLLDKFSFSADDLTWSSQAGKTMVRGNHLHLFRVDGWTLAVLNCHDYTHADLVAAVLRERVDVLVVTTRNKASRLYEEYAIADIHRLCCFIIVNNVSDYGGSGVFAPFGKVVAGRNQLSLGGALFSTRGPCDFATQVALPLHELREVRRQQSAAIGTASSAGSGVRYQPIDPPEHIKLYPETPAYRTAIAGTAAIQRVDLTGLGFRRTNAGPVKIAVAQMYSMAMEDYLANSYHISRSQRCPAFLKKIRSHLRLLQQTRNLPGEGPDFLVFPEVFVPLGFEKELKCLAASLNLIVIAGVEYDPQPNPAAYGTGDVKGTNRCRVYVPTALGVKTVEYVKMTRSQYDARFISTSPPSETLGCFPMTLGDRLLRFTADGLGEFGVLICYDLSHFDLVHAVNLQPLADGSESPLPLDLLFVVAHNPFAELYRRCCLADSHRFYQYVVMCNVAQYGGSGIFGPLRTAGERRTLLYAGKGAEGIFSASVDIDALRRARATSDELLTGLPPHQVMAELTSGETASFQRRPGGLHMRFEVALPEPVKA